VIIQASGVEKTRGGLTVALERLSLPTGTLAALVGPSGCGKSTALDLIAATLRPDRADRLAVVGQDLAVLWQEDDVGALTAWRAKAIGYVLQTGGLLPALSVRENIRLSRRLLGMAGPGDEARIAERLGIAPLLDRYPASLSIGERQRAAIGRALVHEPALVLADEPTAALDPARGAEVMGLLVELTRERGASLLIVTHDADLAERTGLSLIRCQTSPGRTSITAEIS